MDDLTLIAEADALLAITPEFDRVMVASRRSGGCDAVIESARLLRLAGMREAANVLLENVAQITDRVGAP